AMRKDSPLLKAELDAFIAKHPERSTTRAVLFAKYLKNTKFVKNAESQSEMRKFERTVQFFREYSDRYDMDYLLMAAQGYQESRLDQNARSPVGAIGVMQVMPATGKDMKVGDIHNIDANIHAGVKYMRFMVDEFFADEPMDRINKGLFAFAAYNAGPGRIQGLRKEAAKKGLDPNQWFHNVEVVASQKIGRETVTYVANIYKYYVAYKLITESQQEREKAKEELKSARKAESLIEPSDGTRRRTKVRWRCRPRRHKVEERVGTPAAGCARREGGGRDALPEFDHGVSVRAAPLRRIRGPSPDGPGKG